MHTGEWHTVTTTQLPMTTTTLLLMTKVAAEALCAHCLTLGQHQTFIIQCDVVLIAADVALHKEANDKVGHVVILGRLSEAKVWACNTATKVRGSKEHLASNKRAQGSITISWVINMIRQKALRKNSPGNQCLDIHFGERLDDPALIVSSLVMYLQFLFGSINLCRHGWHVTDDAVQPGAQVAHVHFCLGQTQARLAEWMYDMNVK
jgi:hypothetical protein